MSEETNAAPKRPRGRPTLYNEETAALILAKLGEGTPLEEICRADDLPAARTVSDWKKAHASFSADFARARQIGFDAIAYRARQTARGKTEADGGDSSGDVQRDKLIIDTDLKLLAKWDPKRYGEKVALVGGGDDDSPIRTVRRIERVIVDPSASNT